MKKTVCLMIVTGCALICIAAPPTAITNYYSGAVITTATFADAGDTGLTVSNVYVCIPIATVTNAEYTAVMTTNDVRPFVSTLLRHLQESIAAQASSNRFTTFVVSESVRYSSATNRIIFRGINEEQVITITPSYPGE